MKLKQLATIVGAAMLTIANIGSKGQATTLATAQLDSYIPQPGDTVLGTCSQVGLCFPGQTLPLNSSVFPFISRNDSTFDVTTLTFTLDTNQDAAWSQGISNIYSNSQISPDGQVLTFSGGDIPVGGYLFAAAPITPANEVVGVSVSFTGTPVPEPSSVLGMLFLGTIGAGSLLKRQLKF